MIKRRKIKKIYSLLICSLIIIFGICCIILHNYKFISVEKENEVLINDFFEDIKDVNNELEIVGEQQEEVIKDSYIAVLEIPKISLKRGFVDIDSTRNNVNYNIQIINSSDMPDIAKGNLILAGHNGNSYISFFKNLYKLEKGDLSYIYYNNKKYIYQVVVIYEEIKDSDIEIKRDKNKTILTFITCSQNYKDKQVVIISELINIENY